jgi:hypothetical protein
MKIHIRILATLVAVSVLWAERAFCSADAALLAQTSASQVSVQYAKGDTELGSIDLGANVFLGLDYTFQTVPDEIAGLSFTQRHSGVGADVTLDIPAGTTVYLLLGGGGQAAPARSAAESTGWIKAGKATCIAHDHVVAFALYKQTFNSTSHITVKEAGVSDMVASQSLVVLDPITKTPDAQPTPSGDAPAALQNANAPGPVAQIAKNQTEIKGLEILEEDDGTELGQASELILTADPGSKSGDIPVSFASDVGPEMKLVLAELIRWSHVRYPKISGTDKIEYSFEDKYDKHEGGSIGAACGTLFLSMMQGFDIDPNLAMTGDVSADGKVRAIGGVAAKLRGAAVAGCTLVALPEENYEQLVDAEIYDGLPAVTDAQVLGISTLDSAAAVARVDRDSKLAQAIDLFTQIQQSMKQSPDYLKTAKAQTDLQQVLDLDPDHLSAKVLLSIAQGTARTRLTASASEYYTLVAVNFALPMINDQLKSGTKSPVLPAMVDESLNRLRLVHQRSDPHILPLIDAWHDWIQASSDYESGDASDDYLESKRLAVLDAMTKLQANRELIEKMLHEGM